MNLMICEQVSMFLIIAGVDKCEVKGNMSDEYAGRWI